MNKTLLALLFLLALTSGLHACNLGMHEWETSMIIDFPLAGPLLPAAEVNIINDRLGAKDANILLWTSESFSELFCTMLSKNLLPAQWPVKIPWLFTRVSQLDKTQTDTMTLLVNPYKYRLRVMLFKDKLSEYRCQQLVIMQEGRLRLARPNASPPLAEEYTPRTWLSIYFFDQPLPQRIMSITFSPIYGHPHEILLNLEFIENLLNNNLIQRRPSDYVSQYPDGFPTPID
ncbi:MAG: hypothetical protein KKB51_22645 [Candidatus Riflebacteria bacterium]|nr:hypothetical protein [Candidatus Riflebacteria bacterium]